MALLTTILIRNQAHYRAYIGKKDERDGCNTKLVEAEKQVGWLVVKHQIHEKALQAIDPADAKRGDEMTNDTSPPPPATSWSPSFRPPAENKDLGGTSAPPSSREGSNAARQGETPLLRHRLVLCLPVLA